MVVLNLTRPTSSFRTPLRLEYVDGVTWRLTEAFEYHLGHLGSGDIVRAPAGQDTDFASIPPPISWLWPPAHADYGKAAVIHDFLYRGGVVTRADGTTFRPTRKQADDIFLEAMEALGCPGWKRRTIYLAVRIGGVRAYRPWTGTGAGTGNRRAAA